MFAQIPARLQLFDGGVPSASSVLPTLIEALVRLTYVIVDHAGSCRVDVDVSLSAPYGIAAALDIFCP